jgi:hypothetical protein
LLIFKLFVLLLPCIHLNFHNYDYQMMFGQIYLITFQIMPKFMREYSNDLLFSFLVLCRITYHLRLQLHLISLKPHNVLGHLNHLIKVLFGSKIHYQLLCLMNEIIRLLQILNLFFNQKLSIFYLFLFLLLFCCCWKAQKS